MIIFSCATCKDEWHGCVLCYKDGRSLVVAVELCSLFFTVNTTGNVARLDC